MKRFINSLGIGLTLAWALLLAKPAEAQPRVGVNINFQTFYDELSPYGDWIDYPEYGYTWRPRVEAGFRPYATNGYWVYANDYDWMWTSGYDWGWAPFHYGRWFQDPYYGWLWVPGYDWSPAWVTWRGGGDYYGWAPIRPGISISIGFGSYNPPYDYWTFAPGRYMTSRNIGRYYYPYGNNVTIINRTTIINNYHSDRGRRSSYVNGPRRTDVERYTGRINAMSVRSSDRPGRTTVSRNAVSVYRPAVSRTADRSDYAPKAVQRYDRNSVAARGADRNTNRVYSNGARSDNRNDREARVNMAPRREDAINRDAGRRSEDNRTFRDNTGRSSANGSGESSNAARAEQMQRQRSNRSDQNMMEMRQRNEEMRQRNNDAIRQQRSEETRQRSIEMRQQRQAEIQRQPQSGVETQQRAVRDRDQAQRESQVRNREMPVQRQSAPRMESRSESRSFEGRSSSPGRSFGNGERSSSRGGGERGARGR
ncbi:DUF6600 domain-containing protein [Niabella aquatica]